MKDPVFSGADVEEALANAARSLGLPASGLRYVVLERGTPGGRGVSGTPTRIAVLLDTRGAASARPGASAPADAEARRPRATLVALVQQLARAADADLQAELDETEEGLVLRLGGSDRAFFLEEEGEVLQALEHVLLKAALVEGEPRRLIVECEGYRQARDEAIRRKALQLAEAVRTDGRARRTEPLNSYERRLVHMVVSEIEGLRTFSVGEGGDRRVTVAPAGAGDPGTSEPG